jgi:hypothetical protein
MLDNSAKTLGLTFPITLLDRADEVIERLSLLLAQRGHPDRTDQCPVSGGDLNRSTQHLLILLDKEVADGDVTDIVHGEAEG